MTDIERLTAERDAARNGIQAQGELMAAREREWETKFRMVYDFYWKIITGVIVLAVILMGVMFVLGYLAGR